jgi:tetratricopeptide (TPR) repeat protein
MLVPVIGLVQVGRQSMADRYTYLPLIGVLIGVTFAVGDWVVKRRLKAAILILVAGIVMGGCLFATARQLSSWQDSGTLFTHALEVTKDNCVAHNNLGTVLMEKRRWDEAIPHFQKALKIRRYYPEAWYNLGMALLQKGRVDEAINCFHNLFEIQPDLPGARRDLGTALLQKGLLDEAIAQFQKAVEIQTDDVEAYNNLGGTLMQSRRVNEAIAQFQKALALRPRYAEARHNLGIAFMLQGQVDEAVNCFHEALEIKPKYVEALHNLGIALLRKGKLDEGINCFQKALEIEPRNAGVENDLAWILATSPRASLRNGPKAVALAEEADRLSDGKNPATLSTLAAAYAEAGRFPEAIAAAQRALQQAAARNNTTRINTLKTQIGFYQAGSPFRDTSLTNGL